MQKKNIERMQKAVEVLKKYNIIDVVTETMCGCNQKNKRDFVAVYGIKTYTDEFDITTNYPAYYRVYEDGTICRRAMTEQIEKRIKEKLRVAK